MRTATGRPRCIPGFHCGMDSMMRKASLSKLADTLFTTCALITFPFGSMVNSIVTWPSSPARKAFFGYCMLFFRYSLSPLNPPGKSGLCSIIVIIISLGISSGLTSIICFFLMITLSRRKVSGFICTRISDGLSLSSCICTSFIPIYLK